MSVFAHELRNQQLVFWRNKESAVFIFVFPPMLFLLLGAVYDGDIDGVPAVDRLLVGILGYGCANTALAGLAITLVLRREAGILKRLRATPLPPATYLAAVLASTLVVFALQMALTVVLGVLLYDARGPESWAALVPVLLVGALAFAGLGVGLASLIRSAEGASAVVNLVVLPMAFLSGSFGSTGGLPGVPAGRLGRAAAHVPDPSRRVGVRPRRGARRRPSRGGRRRRLGSRRATRRLAALRLGAARALSLHPATSPDPAAEKPPVRRVCVAPPARAA